jgi:hypothetical protein
MEEKTLPKGEGKKELALEKILKIEKAYFERMKAYSSCLTTLKLTKYPLVLRGNILAPRVIRWRIRRHVDLLRESFLLLIAQNRNKIDPKIIKQFESYCEDLDKIGAQVAKSGLIALFYSSIPAGLLGIPYIASVSLEAIYIFLCIFYFFWFFFWGFFASKRIFREATVPEKEKKFWPYSRVLGICIKEKNKIDPY